MIVFAFYSLPPWNQHTLMYNHFFWNNAKGGSNTITRIFLNICLPSWAFWHGKVVRLAKSSSYLLLHRTSRWVIMVLDISKMKCHLLCMGLPLPTLHQASQDRHMKIWCGFRNYSNSPSAISNFNLTPPLLSSLMCTINKSLCCSAHRANRMNKEATGGTPGQDCCQGPKMQDCSQPTRQSCALATAPYRIKWK